MANSAPTVFYARQPRRFRIGFLVWRAISAYSGASVMTDVRAVRRRILILATSRRESSVGMRRITVELSPPIFQMRVEAYAR